MPWSMSADLKPSCGSLGCATWEIPRLLSFSLCQLRGLTRKWRGSEGVDTTIPTSTIRLDAMNAAYLASAIRLWLHAVASSSSSPSLTWSYFLFPLICPYGRSALDVLCRQVSTCDLPRSELFRRQSRGSTTFQCPLVSIPCPEYLQLSPSCSSIWTCATQHCHQAQTFVRPGPLQRLQPVSIWQVTGKLPSGTARECKRTGWRHEFVG